MHDCSDGRQMSVKVSCLVVTGAGVTGVNKVITQQLLGENDEIAALKH